MCKGFQIFMNVFGTDGYEDGIFEVFEPGQDGKTELSLMHFAITNPGWQPPRESTAFLGFLKEQVQRDGAAAGLAQGGLLPENALFTSIQSLQSESEVRS